jgi:hypothetical protein
VRAPGLYLAATGWLFSFLVLHWLGLWAYRELDFERILYSFIVFAPSVVGALAAYVFTPSFRGEGAIDVEAHYFSVAPWAFALAALLVVLAGLTDLLVPGGEPAPLYVFLAGGGLLFWLSRSRSRRVHQVALSVAWVGSVLSVFLGRM